MATIPDEPGRPALQRLLDTLQKVRNPPPVVERVLLVVAFAAFVAVTIIGWQRLPDGAWALRPAWLATAALLSAASVVFNAIEYRLAGRVLGLSVALPAALRISLMSTAANLLPLPGSVLVRTQALQQQGERYRNAFTVTSGVGLAWVGAAALLAGPLAVAGDRIIVGLVFVGVGILVEVVALLLLRLATGKFPDIAFLWRLMVLELASVSASGIRIFAVGAGLGLGVSLPGATAINLAGILSSAAGFLPGGLGLREVLSGVFAEFMGVPGSVGFVVASTDRVISYAVLALMAGTAIGYLNTRGRGTTLEDDTNEPTMSP